MTRLVQIPSGGFVALFGGFKGVALYVLSAVALCSAILVSDLWLEHRILCLLLVTGFTVLEGLLNGIFAAAMATAVLLLVGSVLCFFEVGLFNSVPPVQAWFLVLGIAVIAGGFSMMAALAVGVQRRTAEVADQRQKLLLRVFDTPPIGIWMRAVKRADKGV